MQWSSSFLGGGENVAPRCQIAQSLTNMTIQTGTPNNRTRHDWAGWGSSGVAGGRGTCAPYRRFSLSFRTIYSRNMAGFTKSWSRLVLLLMMRSVLQALALELLLYAGIRPGNCALQNVPGTKRRCPPSLRGSWREALILDSILFLGERDRFD